MPWQSHFVISSYICLWCVCTDQVRRTRCDHRSADWTRLWWPSRDLAPEVSPLRRAPTPYRPTRAFSLTALSYCRHFPPENRSSRVHNPCRCYRSGFLSPAVADTVAKCSRCPENWPGQSVEERWVHPVSAYWRWNHWVKQLEDQMELSWLKEQNLATWGTHCRSRRPCSHCNWEDRGLCIWGRDTNVWSSFGWPWGNGDYESWKTGRAIRKCIAYYILYYTICLCDKYEEPAL